MPKLTFRRGFKWWEIRKKFQKKGGKSLSGRVMFCQGGEAGSPPFQNGGGGEKKKRGDPKGRGGEAKPTEVELDLRRGFPGKYDDVKSRKWGGEGAFGLDG